MTELTKEQAERCMICDSLCDFTNDLREEIKTLKEQLAKAEEILNFYSDIKGENWAGCRDEDTFESCCHMVSEVSGGEKARQYFSEKQNQNKEKKDEK